MKKYHLSVYVIGVIVILTLVNYIAWYTGGIARLKTIESVSLGFLVGMLAMYIAVHIYRWK